MMDPVIIEFFQTECICRRPLKGINGWYYWVPGGDKALIADNQGHRLGATSRVTPRQHLEEFCRMFRS